MNWLFASDGQSIGPSASASVLPVNIQGGVPLGLASLISLLSKGLSGVSPTAQFQSISSSVLSLLYDPTLTFIHDYWENYSFDYTFVSKVMSLIFNMLCLSRGSNEGPSSYELISSTARNKPWSSWSLRRQGWTHSLKHPFLSRIPRL